MHSPFSQSMVGSNFNVTVKGHLGEEYAQVVPYEGSDDDNKALTAFASGGLNTNKNLKSYDCWDEDKTP